ncbi:MAG: hypothetical protein IKU29_09525 [Parabacteroides sp.]|nr:hypothetical protein [Parabacteroides sp.]
MNAVKAMNKSKCQRCMEKMKEEAERQIVENTLENEYKFFEEFEQTAGESIRTADFTLFFSALISVGIEDKALIKDIFDKVVMYSSVSELFGKKLTMEDVQKQLTEEYGLDFRRIEYHHEKLEDFKARYWKENPCT